MSTIGTLLCFSSSPCLSVSVARDNLHEFVYFFSFHLWVLEIEPRLSRLGGKMPLPLTHLAASHRIDNSNFAK